MGLDHLEAIRLHDLEQLDQEQSAHAMGISRATLGRILRQAHRLVAKALVQNRELIVVGTKSVEVECESEFASRKPPFRKRYRGGKNDNI